MDLTKQWVTNEKLTLKQAFGLVTLCRAAGIRLYEDETIDYCLVDSTYPHWCYDGNSVTQRTCINYHGGDYYQPVDYEEVIEALKQKIQSDELEE